MLDAVDFSNTEAAYEYLDNSDLLRAHMLFSAMDRPFFAKWGPRLLNWAFQCSLPISPLLRKTLFAQFCGGESLEACTGLIQKLKRFGVGVVLDYAVESSADEQSREKGCVELLSALSFLKSCEQHFAVFKPTGIMSSEVLQKLSAGDALTDFEKRNFEEGKKRARRIVLKATELGLSVLVDAEESWYQDAIDAWTLDLMREFNKKRPVLYPTVQLYRKDRFVYLENLIAIADEEDFQLGVKLVRGAYMEKENERAKTLGIPSLIHDNKEDCDKAFNASLELCMSRIDRVSLFVGTHNEVSTKKLVQMIDQKPSFAREDHRVVFSQLFGMSDPITFNLSKAGFRTLKYLPYGPVASAIPYLIRRAQENTSVQGQMGRELRMIRKEIARRKLE